MPVDKELSQKIVDLLNGATEADRNAVAALVSNRVPCNEELANHPTIQVAKQHGGFHVGLMGILNGLTGIDEETGWGGILFSFEDDPENSQGYRYFKGFKLVDHEEVKRQQNEAKESK